MIKLVAMDIDGTLLDSNKNLSEENKKQLLIPRGFAHGFLVLSDYAEFVYKCDDFYHPEDEGGIIYNDSSISIESL